MKRIHYKGDKVLFILTLLLPLICVVFVGINEWQFVIRQGSFDWGYLGLGFVMTLLWSIPFIVFNFEFKDKDDEK